MRRTAAKWCMTPAPLRLGLAGAQLSSGLSKGRSDCIAPRPRRSGTHLRETNGGASARANEEWVKDPRSCAAETAGVHIEAAPLVVSKYSQS
jgi:hypothetical protein